MPGTVGKQDTVVFCLGLCFLNFVQVWPSWAEQEVPAGSVLGAACKASPGQRPPSPEQRVARQCSSSEDSSKETGTNL